MGRASSIDEATGERLLEAYQRLGTKSAAAREIGVSEDAASRFFAGLPKAAAPALASQRQVVERAGASLWDARTALDENYQRVLKLYQQLERGIYVQNGENMTLTPMATNVAALREIREHIKAASELFKLLLDIEEVRKFQRAVIEAIRETDPATAQRIIAKLREQHALGLALSGSGGAGH